MTNNDIEEIAYNEEIFNSIKKEMVNVWMNDPINCTELDNNLSNFFINLHEDYSKNCLLIRLLQFQCHCNKVGSSFIVPFYHSRKFTNIDKIVNGFKNSEDTHKLINFFEKYKNPLINYYFWNITFPNIFGSFFSQEFCEAAYTFLTKFKDNAHIFSKGVISFVNHNYLFQNSFLNTFYTLLNRPYKNKEGSLFYGWCEYDQDRFENIILIALIEASKQLSSHQIMALNMLIDTYQEEAEKLIFSDIIIDNLKNIWPYSSYFLPTEMISDINEKYINNQQSLTNSHTLLQNFFKEVKNLTAKNEFKMSELVSMNESFIVTHLDLIIIYAFNTSISTSYPNIQEDLQTLLQINDDLLVDFMLNRCFKYYRLDISIPHSIKPKIQKTKCSESIIQEWQRHEEECKRRNENPLSAIFNNEPIDKNVAFYGLYTSYQQRKSLQDYKTELTKKMGKLIPLQKSVEFQDSMIEMSFLRLTKLMESTEFPDSLIMLYINHIKSLFSTFSMEYLISNPELVPLYKTVFEETFTNQYQSDLLLCIKDFTIKKDPSLILIEFSQKIFTDLKNKLADSIPDDMNLNGKKKQEISSALKRKTLRLNDSKSYSLEMIRKIEFALTINHFLNSPQEFTINSSYSNGRIDFSELLTKTFDELDDKGVFSYIGAVCYRLFSEYKTSSKLNIGIFLDSVPNVLKMINQFLASDEIVDKKVHPSIEDAIKVNSIESFVDCVFEYSLSSIKMTRYKDLINEYKKEKNNVLTFYIKAVEYVSVFINENKFNESFSSIHNIIQQIDELRSYLPILIKAESDSNK